jgi:DNA repair exonuclease SbcCD ATPase subunit/DNA repair exonuclease SbcCD nuclease subunit
MFLLTGDWHLDDLPANEYRWRIFNFIEDAFCREPVKKIIIAGDLSDQKDRHSSILVNRVVSELTKITRFVPIIFLPGNHDRPLEGPPFWEFLGHLDRLEFVDRPKLIDRALFLPHRANPKEEWEGFDDLKKRAVAIVMHQTVSGAREGDRIYQSSSLPELPTDIPIYSGDIHTPQKIGNVTYIGAPHAIKFGDDYPYRMILVDESFQFVKEIRLPGISKKVIAVRSPEDLAKAPVEKGDQIKIRVALKPSDLSEWKIFEEEIHRWAQKELINLISIETEIPIPETSSSRMPLLSPEREFAEFCAERELGELLQELGLDCLSEASKELSESSGVRGLSLGWREIRLKWIGLKNFKSFREPSLFSLPEDPGLRLLIGKNLVTPSLGANGAGKSAIWEGLCFCLFGTTPSGQKASDLESWGSKKIESGVGLLVDGKELTIIRESSPNRIWIDGELSSQEEILKILRMRKEQFFHSIIFGQGAPMFYDLSAPEKGRVLDEILEASIWINAAEKASLRQKETEQELRQRELDLSRLEGREESLQKEESLQELSDRFRAQKKSRMEKLHEELLDVQRQSEEIERELKALEEEFSDSELAEALDELREQEKELLKAAGSLQERKRQESSSLEEIRKGREFYQRNSICPVCRQDLEEGFRERKIAEMKDRERSSLKQQEALLKEEGRVRELLESCRSRIERLEQEQKLGRQELETLRSSLSRLELRRRSLNKDLNREILEDDPYEKMIQGVREERQRISEEKAELLSTIERIRQEREAFRFWAATFKHLRYRVVEKVLDSLSIEVETAANSLGLKGWEIKFEHELETESGTIKPGIYLAVRNRESPQSKGPWSGGESQRIRLAVSWGLANLIRRLLAVRFDLEVYDEPISWLSEEGVGDLLECLKSRAESLDRQIWLIYHHPVPHSGFTEIWEVLKSDQGSEIRKVGAST